MARGEFALEYRMANPIVTDVPIIGPYNKQRFKQFDPSDCANWYLVPDEIGKKKMAAYPTMGRRHVTFQGVNRLKFDDEPRMVNQSANYWYAVVGDKIFRIDRFFQQVEITSTTKLTTLVGDVFFTYLVIGTITFAAFVDGQQMYVYREDTGQFYLITDPLRPPKPKYIATFGNRMVVSSEDSSTFYLTEFNLGGAAFDPAKVFEVGYNPVGPVAGAAVFAQEEGVIRQMGVLQNTLYIFTDFTAGIWSNIPSVFFSSSGVQTTFPWKKNTSYSFDTGISQYAANTLDIDFGMMCWLGQNRNGLVQPMMATGGKPKPFSSKAIDVLLQRKANIEQDNPFLTGEADGFLFDYENTIFYRLSAGEYTGTQLIDQISTSNSIEYNFDTQTWHRNIEANGERNRIQKHVFFSNRHLVTVLGDSTVYEMSGAYYNNEITNPDQADPNASDYYLQLPFRYERITPIIVAGNIDGLKAPGFYAEFKTNYVEIDFVWGDDTFINSTAPFANAVYLVDEVADADGNPIFMVDDQDTNIVLLAEEGNYPVMNSPTYNNWFKPSIELLFSNDGGINFQSAGNLEFSQIGVYQWRMRWYQLGCSRNRVYKLVCVSPAPIVVLGGVMEVENVSGGAA